MVQTHLRSVRGRRAFLLTLCAMAMLLAAGVTSVSPRAAAPDPLGFRSRGHVYVTSPTGIASALVNDTGIVTVSEARGGGDTDVTADTSGVMYTYVGGRSPTPLHR